MRHCCCCSGQLKALLDLRAGCFPRFDSSVGIAPMQMFFFFFFPLHCYVSFSCSSRDDRYEARAAFDSAWRLTTCGSCCSGTPLFKAMCQHQLINPHFPVGLRGDSVPHAFMPGNRGSKSLELGKPQGSAVLLCVHTQGTCKCSILHMCLQGFILAMQRAESSAALEMGLELLSPCSAGGVFNT